MSIQYHCAIPAVINTVIIRSSQLGGWHYILLFTYKIQSYDFI